VTPDECRSAYRRALGEFEPVVIRRYTGTGANRPKFEATVMGRVLGYTPADLIGTIQQGDKRLVILADDLIDAQFDLPLQAGDKAVIRGKEHNIEAPDDSSRRLGGVLIAYELQVRG